MVRLAFIIIFEHVVFGVTRIAAFLIPDVPRSIRHAIAKERHESKRKLEDTGHLYTEGTDDMSDLEQVRTE